LSTEAKKGCTRRIWYQIDLDALLGRVCFMDKGCDRLRGTLSTGKIGFWELAPPNVGGRVRKSYSRSPDGIGNAANIAHFEDIVNSEDVC